MQIVKFQKISFDDGCFIFAPWTSAYPKLLLHIINCPLSGTK